MNSLFIGLGVFSFLFLFGLSFVIDAVRRKPRKAKKEFNWGKLDGLNEGSIFDDVDDVVGLSRDNRGRFIKQK